MPGTNLSIVDETLRIARTQMGQQEVPRGSNRGPMVSVYQRVTGYSDAVPWCLCFCYWCIEVASQGIGIGNPVTRTGSCDILLEWAKRHGLATREPARGDIGLVLAKANSNDAIHAFMVDDILDGNRLRTIEGNSNNDGSREGYLVCQRDARRISDKLIFIRWYYLADQVERYHLVVNGAEIAQMEAIRGVSRAPVRKMVTALGISSEEVVWDDENQGVSIRGQILPSQVLMVNGVSFAPFREIIKFLNDDLEMQLEYSVNLESRIISIPPEA